MSTEPASTLLVVLDHVRSGQGTTRPELMRRTDLGRTAVNHRVTQLINAGLVTEGPLGPSTGGRAPRELRFRADTGILLVAELGATSISTGIADLSGTLLDQRDEDTEPLAGPEATLDRVADLFDHLLAGRGDELPPVWGIGIGVLGPVDYAAGRPAALPLMPGWADYPVRDRLMARFGVPVWVDNEVNLMALGELRSGLGKGLTDLVFLKIGSGIGAGVVAGGRLQRGGQGAAGEVGHFTVVEDDSLLCWCGNAGCLVQYAGGAALGRAGADAAADGRSRYLAERRAAGHVIDARDVSAGARAGDEVCIGLITRAGYLIGKAAGYLVNALNPTLIVIGGGVAATGDILLAAVRRTLYQRAMPLATRDLKVALSTISDTAGLTGAAFMVIDEILSVDRIGDWIDDGTPVSLTKTLRGDTAPLAR